MFSFISSISHDIIYHWYIFLQKRSNWWIRIKFSNAIYFVSSCWTTLFYPHLKHPKIRLFFFFKPSKQVCFFPLKYITKFLLSFFILVFSFAHILKWILSNKLSEQNFIGANRLLDTNWKANFQYISFFFFLLFLISLLPLFFYLTAYTMKLIYTLIQKK